MAKSHVLPKTSLKALTDNLLTWYAKHHRVLPWRVVGKRKPNPYHVWLSEVMLQQTTVQAVIPYFEKFTSTWATVTDLAQAETEDVMQAWAGLGYYARARNLLKCARTIADSHSGEFPKTEAELLALPGIGPYTAAAITAIAYNQPAVVVDGNIERVCSRVFEIAEPLPASKKSIKSSAALIFAETNRCGDLAQALMDLGATICIPQKPRCGVCPIRDFCVAHRNGTQDDLPRKQEKKPRPMRAGTVYWLTDVKGRVIIETRADGQMLGGMPGFPSSDWDKSGISFKPFKNLENQAVKIGNVYHTFTHFDLNLEVMEACISSSALKRFSQYKFVAMNDLRKVGFPTLFKKVLKLKMSSR